MISLVVASLMHQPILRVAKKYGIYDNPDARKLQRIPIPVMGGFVVFAGAIIGSLCYWFVHDCTAIIPIQVAMVVMLLLGAYDDMKNLSPYLKFAVEIALIIGLICVNGYSINDLHGLWGIHEFSPWIAWPFTVFVCVGIINAINMVDGVDGLSSGLCIMILGFYSWIFFVGHEYVRAALGCCLMGGLIPFFVFNVFGERSKMFIGDAGTLMLGIAISDMVMAMTAAGSAFSQRLDVTAYCIPAFILAGLAVPVFDTIRVMSFRMWRGRSPFRPDKTHLHHAFIDYGFHHLETALLEIFLNMMVIMLWFVLAHSYLPVEWQLYGVVLAGSSISFLLFWLLGRRRRMARRLAAAKSSEERDSSNREKE